MHEVSLIMLIEVLRKLWTGLVVQQVTNSQQKHEMLSPSPLALTPSGICQSGS